MRNHQLAIGAYVALADPQVIEIMGFAGIDAAFIDMEHTGFDLSLVGEMIRAADLAGITSMVRVPDNDAKLIMRLLDMGAEGIVVPHIDGVGGAEQAVASVRYPPLGKRGSARAVRASGFGSANWENHVWQSNEEILLSVMVEDEKGIREIEKIAGLDGLDLVGIGPTDLSSTMGIHDRADPRLRAKVEEIAKTIRRIGKAKLSFPLSHASLTLGPEELIELSVAYANLGPAPPSILFQTWQREVRQIHRVSRQSS